MISSCDAVVSRTGMPCLNLKDVVAHGLSDPTIGVKCSRAVCLNLKDVVAQDVVELFDFYGRIGN